MQKAGPYHQPLSSPMKEKPNVSPAPTPALPGAMIIPILLSTNKTQLTLFRNKNVYPIHMTIGNIPKEIHCKPSSHAYVLLGYLPTTWLETVNNQAKKRHLLSNMYHVCMTRVTEPLKSAGEGSVNMSTAMGHVHHNHPIFGSFIGDYPEC